MQRGGAIHDVSDWSAGRRTGRLASRADALRAAYQCRNGNHRVGWDGGTSCACGDVYRVPTQTPDGEQ